MRRSQELDPRAQYGEFIRGFAQQVRGSTSSPADAERWEARLARVRQGLTCSFARALGESCDLDPEVLGVSELDGYVVERLTFQSRPGVRVTANLYRPSRIEQKAAGVLCVHGHWPWARIDPVVQSRCIGLAKLGYVCLSVDAFGAGERAIAPAPGTYHGGPIGGSLWAASVPLIGLQVHDNRRAVDYLCSRPDVDAARLAVTGASGGGNQSLYAGALDDRLKAVVPVCGVGTYEDYLETACCVCETNPGGLTYAGTGDLLAMVAPRALLVISASRDARQFSPPRAAVSLAYARPRFEALGAADRVRQVVIESGHDYSRPMREAMYGWLDLWLRGRGDGSPVAEPDHRTVDPTLLRCYPDASTRPPTIVTIPAFVSAESRARVESLAPPPDHRQAWEAEAVRVKAELAKKLGGLPGSPPPAARAIHDPAHGHWAIDMAPEPGLTLRGYLRIPSSNAVPPKSVILMSKEDEVTPEAVESWTDESVKAGHAACIVELRALGRLKPQTAAVAGAVDHNEAQWGVWVGRPLLGQWVFDLLQWAEAVTSILDGPRSPIPGSRGIAMEFHGKGVGGTASILAAAYSPRVQAVRAEGAFLRYRLEEGATPRSSRMGLMVPHILQLGDLGRLAALAAPGRLSIRNPIGAEGTALSSGEIETATTYARRIYALMDAADAFDASASG